MKQFAVILLLLLWPVTGYPDTAVIAVASNFKPTLEQLAASFERDFDHRLTLTSASTGTLYNQILHGAPFDIFLAADNRRPQLLAEQGKGVKESLFVYARGQLALIGDGLEQQASLPELLKNNPGKLAIANPDTAPYGLAAKQLLQQLGLWDSLQYQLVRGNTVAQAYQFVDTGSATLGLVALSQAINSHDHYRNIPTASYPPIQQQAILLQSAADNMAARDFLKFLKTSPALNIITSNGYSVAERD